MNARISIAQYRRQKAASEPFTDRWHEYEQRKQAWLRTNSEASHEEYQVAMRELARKLGV
jgi:hypothetical protein